MVNIFIFYYYNDLTYLKRLDFEGNKIKFLPSNLIEINHLEMIG